MSRSHTPGPWQLKETADFLHAIFASDGPVAITFTDNSIKPREMAEKEANARLIAAAPELLEAAKALLLALSDDLASKNPWLVTNVQKAIAKADGEEK